MSKVSVFAKFSRAEAKGEEMEAAQRHGDADATQAAMPAVMTLLAGPPDMSMTPPVAANGLDI